MSKVFLACCILLFYVSPALAFDSNLYPYAGVILGTPLTSVNKLSDSSGSLNTEFNPGFLAGLTAGQSSMKKLAGT